MDNGRLAVLYLDTEFGEIRVHEDGCEVVMEGGVDREGGEGALVASLSVDVCGWWGKGIGSAMLSVVQAEGSLEIWHLHVDGELLVGCLEFQQVMTRPYIKLTVYMLQ